MRTRKHLKFLDLNPILISKLQGMMILMSRKFPKTIPKVIRKIIIATMRDMTIMITERKAIVIPTMKAMMEGVITTMEAKLDTAMMITIVIKVVEITREMLLEEPEI